MCLAGEVCIKYPMDLDLHCVPQSIIDDPITPIGDNPDVPEDCWKQLGSQNGIFPPNSSCWNHFQNTQVDIMQYERTCIYEPIAHYTAKRYKNSLSPSIDQPFTKCGVGGAAPDGTPAPGGTDPECLIAMLVYTDVREAETGSYGPSPDTEASYSADFIAQNYLYTSLFGRPMDLSDSYDPQNNAGNDGHPTREAYRTYWRLLPASNQANLRSFVLNMANKDQIDNINFDFVDRNGLKKKTDFKKLYNALSKQVILFWHWPFIRVGCLVDYPVCPEYAQATESLKPMFQELRELALDLDLGFLADTAILAYEAAISAFGNDLDGPYAAFVPLDFNGTRSYIVKKKDEKEESYYGDYPWAPYLVDEDNAGRYGTNKPGLTNVSRESVPYVGAIYQGLLSPKFGMFPALQPQWIVDKYASPSGISDYRIGNTLLSLPEVKLAQKGFLERVKEETIAIVTNPFGWLWNKVTDLFTNDELKKVGYTENEIDNLNEKVKDGYANITCPLPVSYHLIAPKTAAGDRGDPNQRPADDHHQVLSIRGDKLSWNYDPQCHPPTEKEKCDDNGHCWIEYGVCPINEWEGRYKDQKSGQCCRMRWTVEGISHGKTLNVLNNPKHTDIKETVANNDQYSFYKMILPDGVDKTVNASIDAPIARHFVSYRVDGVDAGATSTGPNGNSDILNPAEPINRVNNLAQDSMHLLQNCWTVPKELQNSPRCYLLPTPTPPVVCSTDLSFLKGGSCKLCNTDKITQFTRYVHESQVPEKIPKTLQDILETVGSTFSVPPSSVLAVMLHEGAFNRSFLTWTDANAKEWAICGGAMPIADGQMCDPAMYSAEACSSSGSCNISIAGFGWRPYYFWEGEGEIANWTAVQKIDPTRTKENISPCNLLDAAAATAKALSRGAAYLPPTVTSDTCFELPMTNTSIPGSCSAWTDATVLQSHISYAGYCPETGKNGIYPPLDTYKEDVLDPYHTFSCGQ